MNEMNVKDDFSDGDELTDGEFAQLEESKEHVEIHEVDSDYKPEELWRFTEREIAVIREALNMLYHRLMQMKSDNEISGTSNDDVNIMLHQLGKLIDRVQFLDPEVLVDDYIRNYNNADEHEIYGVNPLEYEK